MIRRPCACVRVHVRGERCATDQGNTRTPAAPGLFAEQMPQRRNFREKPETRLCTPVGPLLSSRRPPASATRGLPCANGSLFFFLRSFGGCWGMELTISPPRHPGITACSAAPRTRRTRCPSACLLSRRSMKLRPTNRGVVLPSWWSFHPSFAQLESDYCQGGPPSTYRWVM